MNPLASMHPPIKSESSSSYSSYPWMIPDSLANTHYPTTAGSHHNNNHTSYPLSAAHNYGTTNSFFPSYNQPQLFYYYEGGDSNNPSYSSSYEMGNGIPFPKSRGSKSKSKNKIDNNQPVCWVQNFSVAPEDWIQVSF
jgi:hypothetical protein